MKFTLSWLKEHLDTTATLAQITEALTDLGLEVEGVTDPAARLGTFTLAKVLEAVQHPDADRLRVCRVMTDEGEKQIVCGAPNARAGITVVLAKPGRLDLATEDKGRVVVAFLENFFSRYVEYDFTADLEEQLDRISKIGRASCRERV